jgi:hypothetical protein
MIADDNAILERIRRRKAKDCRQWPNCSCIAQGKEGVDCPEQSNRNSAEHLLED